MSTQNGGKVPDNVPAEDSAVPEEWDEFDRAARPKLRAAFAYAAHDGIDPDDIVQEVLIEARAHFVPLASFRLMYAWCRTHGTFAIQSARRRGYGRYERPHHDPAGAAPPRGDAVVPGVDGAAIDRALVDAILAALSPADREILDLARLDLSPEQIAQRLNIGAGTARVRLLRARRRFRKQLGGHAALLPLGGWRLRRAAARADLAAVANHPQATVVGLTAAAGLAVAVAVFGAATQRSMPATANDAGTASTLPIRTGIDPATEPPRREASRVGAARPRPAQRSEAVPRHPSVHAPSSVVTCALTVCVRAGGGQGRGDTVTVTAAGPNGPSVSQHAVPICHRVPDNPAAACTRQEPDRWTVKDVPPRHSTGGNPP